MKQLLQQYASYNLWANKRILQTAAQLSEEQVTRKIMSSFSSIYKTVMHMMEVENVWWERLQLMEKTTPTGLFNGNFEELSKKLVEFSQRWENWVMNADEVKINYVFAWYNFKKEYFKEPVYKVLMHLFNHQTFHRGQAVTIFRQLGLDKIPSTDLIVFTRKKQ